MATFYIEEYASIMTDFAGNEIPVPSNLLATQKLPIGSTSVQSANFNEKTAFLVLTAKADAQYEIDTNPTADTNSRIIIADTTIERFANGSQKIAVIEAQ